MKYAVVEIAGRQYVVEPEKAFLVNYLGDTKDFECDKVLLLVTDGKMQFGDPYLKEKIKFNVLDTITQPKIRVATYKAKANTRKVRGSKQKMSKISLQVSKTREKK